MSRNQPSTVGTVIKRLRRMLGHLGKRERETVLEAIEAIEELSTRLFEATHVEKKPSAGLAQVRRESETLVRVVSSPLDPHHVTPRSTGVVTDIEELGAVEGHPI